MRRVIKFRAWNKSLRQMYLDGWHGRCAGEGGMNSTNDHLAYLQSHDIELMQYTGLQDKNGVDIYESDVVENLAGKRGVVIWNDSRAAWDLYGATHLLGDIPLRSIRVIGNICEDGDLLEPTS